MSTLEQQASNFAGLLYALGFKCVAFDMDQCLVTQHSMGRLQRGKQLEDYVASTTADFIAATAALAQDRVKLAVATHSDEAEYGLSTNQFGTHKTYVEYHIMGSELTETVLAEKVPAYAAQFKIVAYNPGARKHPLRKTTHKGLDPTHQKHNSSPKLNLALNSPKVFYPL